jgi:hypothetical protein
MDPNDLFEVVWESYPGQNTWQRRCELWGARAAVAIFEHPERFINNKMSTAQERYYGTRSKMTLKEVNKNIINNLFLKILTLLIFSIMTYCPLLLILCHTI